MSTVSRRTRVWACHAARPTQTPPAGVSYSKPLPRHVFDVLRWSGCTAPPLHAGVWPLAARDARAPDKTTARAQQRHRIRGQKQRNRKRKRRRALDTLCGAYWYALNDPYYDSNPRAYDASYFDSDGGTFSCTDITTFHVTLADTLSASHLRSLAVAYSRTHIAVLAAVRGTFAVSSRDTVLVPHSRDLFFLDTFRC